MRSRVISLSLFGVALVALLAFIAMSERPNSAGSISSPPVPGKDSAARAAELAAYEVILSEKRKQADKIMREGRPAAPLAPAKGAKPNMQYEQAAYARRLEKALLSNSASADVFVEPGPQLTIFMYMSKATVYRMAKDGHILDNASNLHFKQVRFFSKDGESWYFDLSKSIPTCDTIKKLCL